MSAAGATGGKLVGNGIVAGMVSVASVLLAALLMMIFQYIAVGYGMIFYARLCETVMANPLKVVPAKKK